jgi:hypothetical protein
MRLKVLLAFLAIQITGFLLWQGVCANSQKEVEILRPAESVTVVSPASQEPAPINAIPDLSHVRFSSRTESSETLPIDPERKSEVMKAMKMLPEAHTGSLEHVILDYDPNARRGLGGKRLIILRGVNMNRAETVAVLIHEIGHVVDLGMMNGESEPSEFMDGDYPVRQDDLSLAFYRISWENDTTLKTGTDAMDFVSGYAMSDPFEDFAESYVYYVLHQHEFREKTRSSNQLLRKYTFLQNAVFDGAQFESGESDESGDISVFQRPWDITKLPYDLNAFLG